MQPAYQALREQLRSEIAAGTPIVLADLEIDEGSLLLAERRRQDERFFGKTA